MEKYKSLGKLRFPN
jgi:hypothetical protein